MGRKPTAAYLRRPRPEGPYYANLEIPDELRKLAGGRIRFRESLGTKDQTKATAMAMVKVGEWKLILEELRRHPEYTPSDELERIRLDRLKAIKEADIDQAEALEQHAENLIEKSVGDPRESEEAAKVLKDHLDNRTRLAPLVEAFGVAYCDVHLSKKSSFQYRQTLKGLIAVGFTHIESLNPKDLFHHFKNRKIAVKTMRREIATCNSFWKFLQAEGYVDLQTKSPFILPLNVATMTQPVTTKIIRKSFTPQQVVDLVKAVNEDDPTLKLSIWIAAYLGTRIEETGRLKWDDITMEDSGTGAPDIEVVRVRGTKGPNADRVVPLHPALKGHLEAFKKTVGLVADGYILPSNDDNQLDARTNGLGRRFSRLKTKLGHGPDLVYHSIRKTVATSFERAGVPESVAADILGHEKTQTLSYGLYSSGSSTKQKSDAILTLRYPE